MAHRLTRRHLLAAGGVALASDALPRLAHAATGSGPPAAGTAGLPPTFPQQDPERVRETVGASHGRFDRVRKLVEVQPALAKATWDWGFGDWESALGAAAHTGQRDIALFLLAHGARLDVFAAAMLGWLPAVRAMIEAQPELARTPGPHSIPLLSHALAGGEAARGVRDYLESLDVDAGPPDEPLPAGAREALLGVYAAEGRELEVEIGERQGGLTLGIGPGFPRGLAHRGELVFQVAGAEAVTVRFEVGESGGHVRLTLADGPVRLVALRAG